MKQSEVFKWKKRLKATNLQKIGKGARTIDFS